MRLSDFKGTDAIDVLADIMQPASEIISDPELQALAKTKGTPYMTIAVYVLKNHKDVVLEIYETLTREKKEEATPTKILQLLLDIIGDPELNQLFFSQGQQEALKSSGSVMENTEDGDH